MPSSYLEEGGLMIISHGGVPLYDLNNSGIFTKK